MMNTIEIDGYRAVISYDLDTEVFRGEFVGLNGSADFFAKDAESLKKEGAISLQVFLDVCAEDGVPPRKPSAENLTSAPPPSSPSIDFRWY